MSLSLAPAAQKAVIHLRSPNDFFGSNWAVQNDFAEPSRAAIVQGVE
jgi:hypothetical protein